MTDTARQAPGPPGTDPGVGDDAAVIALSLHAPECFGVLFDRHAPTLADKNRWRRDAAGAR
jgi:hypothetical protein